MTRGKVQKEGVPEMATKRHGVRKILIKSDSPIVGLMRIMT
jgi:hypothetical protein